MNPDLFRTEFYPFHSSREAAFARERAAQRKLEQEEAAKIEAAKRAMEARVAFLALIPAKEAVSCPGP